MRLACGAKDKRMQRHLRVKIRLLSNRKASRPGLDKALKLFTTHLRTTHTQAWNSLSVDR